MVHALAHSPRLQAGHLQERPDPTRIVAFSGAIAVNAIAMLLLLMPMSAPPPVTLPDTNPRMIWVHPEKKPEIVPVVPVQQPLRQKTQPATKSPRQANIAPPTDQVVAEQGTEAVVPVIDAVVASTTVEPPANPIAAVRLEYASAPPPAYPRDALRSRAEGTVLLQVLVDSDGHPLDVQVQSSSGNRSLDEAARKHVLKNWRFRPAMRDGVAVQAIGVVPIDFKLAR